MESSASAVPCNGDDGEVAGPGEKRPAGGGTSALRAHVLLSKAPPSHTSGLPMHLATSLQVLPSMETGADAEGGEVGLPLPAVTSC